VRASTHPATLSLEQTGERGAHGELPTPLQREAIEVLRLGEIIEHLVGVITS